MEIDPGFLYANYFLGRTEVQRGHFAAAIEALERTVALSGGAAVARSALGYALARSGDETEALAIAERLEAPAGDEFVSAFEPAYVRLGLGDDDAALAGFERAVEQRTPFVDLARRPAGGRITCGARRDSTRSCAASASREGRRDLASPSGTRWAARSAAAAAPSSTWRRTERLERQVAIKVLLATLASPAAIDRFLREVRISSRLVHPNIVQLFESGVADGLPFYVMPFVEGETLRSVLERQSRLPVAAGDPDRPRGGRRAELRPRRGRRASRHQAREHPHGRRPRDGRRLRDREGDQASPRKARDPSIDTITTTDHVDRHRRTT